MQIIVFTKETGKLVLHSGPYIITTNHIIELEGIISVYYKEGFYEASAAGGEIKLRVPINHTNVIYQ